jgi:hypothetical protein
MLGNLFVSQTSFLGSGSDSSLGPAYTSLRQLEDAPL